MLSWSSRLFAGGRRPTPDYAGTAYASNGRELQDAARAARTGRVSQIVVVGRCYISSPLDFSGMRDSVLIEGAGTGKIVCKSTGHPVFRVGHESGLSALTPTLYLTRVDIRGANFDFTAFTGSAADGHFAGVLVEQTDDRATLNISDSRLFIGDFDSTESGVYFGCRVKDNLIYHSNGDQTKADFEDSYFLNNTISGGIALSGGENNLIQGNNLTSINTSGGDGGNRVLGNDVTSYTAHGSDTAANNT